MEMINEFIILRLKVYEICLIFHEVMPDDYEFIDLDDISISLDTELNYICVRNNHPFYNAEHLRFGAEWLNRSNTIITKMVKKLKSPTKD